MNLRSRAEYKLGTRTWFALSILVIAFVSLPVFGQGEPTEAQVVQSLAFRLWIVIVAAVIALFARWILIRRLNKLMLSASRKADEFVVDETPKHEVPASRKLSVFEKDVGAAFGESSPAREGLVAGARKGINRLFLVQIVIVASYAVAYQTVLLFEFSLYADYLLSQADPEPFRRAMLNLQAYSWLLIFFFGFTVLQFLANRLYFSAVGRRGYAFIVQGFWGTTLAVLVLIFTLFFALTLFAPILLIAPALHLVLWWWLRRSGRKRANIKLLILRVFLLKKTSHFTFNGLVKAWKHLGNYFTASDPSFYKVAWKRRFRHVFPVYIILIFFVYTLATDTNKAIESEIFTAFIVLLIIGNLLFMLNSRSRMKLNFMSSPDVLAKRFKAVEDKPTRVDNTFREVPIMCHDNTWQQAVDGMIDKANVVLMDLRGFSEKNLGSAYEINILFDRVPAQNIVFMSYEDTLPLVRRVIDQQWEMLAEDSPNLEIENPYTTLYKVTRENRREMQGILAVLLEATGSNAGR